MFNRSVFRSGGYHGAPKPTIPEDFGTSNAAVLSEKRHARGFAVLFVPPQIVFFLLHIKVVVLAETADIFLKIEHDLNTFSTLFM